MIKFGVTKLSGHDLDLAQMLYVLGNRTPKSVKPKDKKIIESYFTKGYLGYGAFVDGVGMIAYCFIKNPETRPETLTVVDMNYRNKGVATELRNRAIALREFKGNIVYSACEYNNIASFKSLIKGGFQVFDITKDKLISIIQFIKILRY